MKKTFMAIVMSALLLGACSKPAEPAPAATAGTDATADPSASLDISQLKTMGDVFAVPGAVSNQVGFSSNIFHYEFEVGGKAYRAAADLTKEVSYQLFALDFDDPDYEKKRNDLVAPLPVRQVDDLTAMILPQEELDKLVGKTGQELIDAGWKPNGGYMFENSEVYMDNGPISYTVSFDGELVENEEYDTEKMISELKVKSITYNGIGDVANGLE